MRLESDLAFCTPLTPGDACCWWEGGDSFLLPFSGTLVGIVLQEELKGTNISIGGSVLG